MKVLLDTHVWLWWMIGSKRLTEATKSIVLDPNSTTYFSVASAWEIAIKYALGKLALPAPPSVYISSRTRSGDFKIMDIRLEHALAAGSLPRHHDDPFDRLLVAQAVTDGCRIITADERLLAYNVDVVTA